MTVERWWNIFEFYKADDRRRLSPELDFGVMWIDGDAAWPHYRVSWVEATGDVYAIALAGDAAGMVELLGSTPAGDRAAVQAALIGWADLERSELGWVQDRLTIRSEIALASDSVLDVEGRDARFSRTDDGYEDPAGLS